MALSKKQKAELTALMAKKTAGSISKEESRALNALRTHKKPRGGKKVSAAKSAARSSPAPARAAPASSPFASKPKLANSPQPKLKPAPSRAAAARAAAKAAAMAAAAAAEAAATESEDDGDSDDSDDSDSEDDDDSDSEDDDETEAAPMAEEQQAQSPPPAAAATVGSISSGSQGQPRAAQRERDFLLAGGSESRCHGEGLVRLLKLRTEGAGVSEVREYSVTTRLYSDDTRAYTADKTKQAVVSASAQHATVNAVAASTECATPESFGVDAARAFLAKHQAVTACEVEVEATPWARSTRHGFTLGEETAGAERQRATVRVERWTAQNDHRRGGQGGKGDQIVSMTSGISGLTVLRTATGLAGAGEEVLRTEISADWQYLFAKARIYGADADLSGFAEYDEVRYLRIPAVDSLSSLCCSSLSNPVGAQSGARAAAEGGAGRRGRAHELCTGHALRHRLPGAGRASRGGQGGHRGELRALPADRCGGRYRTILLHDDLQKDPCRWFLKSSLLLILKYE